ncbi:TPA: ATP-binding protein [Klebsiella pneumoniae]|uniref:AVAST type 2 anti-phage system protein Avs2 n=2 Tax=Klebsiella pneumoniae complex TaxID=3390273 RepID=UPI002181B038|nr:ATP-binding protein [Klebsiella pneumoniae]HDT5529476.1 ATP-binding protein [Klebsiella pneumoniae subsp. ozaenae]GKM27785.1 ATPase AAA [Klebsiella pneumoniae]HBQ4001941.1 ATP-binding protein [Klebsiella pneumoniae]HBV2583247.1 ATP-binding protein [Klebsiella pneumoniae]
MEPISITVATYVATKLIDQFISQEGYGWIKKTLFPEKKYVDRLYQLIEETAIEFEKTYPVESGGIPFYHSKPLFEMLNEHILFKELPDKDILLGKFNEYPSITPPTQQQLNLFYGMLSLKINNCSTLKKLHIEETYKEKIFDINEELIQIKLVLRSIDEKLTFHLSDDWLNEKNSQAIADLGGRYTPELNVKLEIAKIFDGLGRTNNFSDIFYSHIDYFLITGNKLHSCDAISSQLSEIGHSLREIANIYQKINFSKLDEIPINEFNKFVSSCQTTIGGAESILWELQEKPEQAGETKHYNDNYSSTLRLLRELDYACNDLLTFINSTTVKLANNPFLLLEGKAGIGKSHLLADVIKNRIVSGYPSLLILGQQLTSDESPWSQIFKRLQLKITSREFLEKLNLYGKKTGKRVLIFIDAINEGNGNKFWNDNINSFVDEIRRFEWLGLIMSVRTTYRNVTISHESIERNNFEIHEHIGFQNVELEAVSLFYDYYNIERPSSPNLNPEFKNPLFLKLLCEGIKKNGLTKVPVGFNGISNILNFLVEGVNKSLSSPRKYDFDPSFPLVKDALNEIIKFKLEIGSNSISLKDAHLVVQSVVNDYVADKHFLSALIDEGLLTKGIVRNDDNSTEEVVYVAFERFDDHLTVKFLLDEVKDIENEFKADGRLKCYFHDECDFYINSGIVEALSIQLPEKYGKELYEFLPEFRDNHKLIEAFIDSLIWRDIKAIDFEKIKPFINEHVFRFDNSFDHFLETVISITGLVDHPFNANFLHVWLKDHTLPNRDSFWTTKLKYKYSEESAFRHLIDWAWNRTDKTFISDESIELVATSLCWFLTSSNRELRDCSTKALVSLLEPRIPVLRKIIDKFYGVNDPYVWERIFAVALGCTLRTDNVKEIKFLAETVYQKVFCSEYVYPNILLRDYAREIIEFANHLGLELESIELSKTRPPYNSIWPDVIPSRKELESLYDKDPYRTLWSSIMGGGDFSRYIIGTNYNHSDWSGCKFNETPIDRKQVYRIFKGKLTNQQKELYDATNPVIYDDKGEEIKFGDIKIKFGVAIGRKKPEEIKASKELFKKSLSYELLSEFENDIEPYLDHNNKLLETDKHFDLRLAEQFIFNRVVELGWDPEKHGYFDRQIGTGRGRRGSLQERIGKKYQWIAYYEYMARLADNFIRFEGYGDERKENLYQGPWEPYVRDIDPTILLKETGTKKISNQEMWWLNDEVFDWTCSNENWVKSPTTITNPHALIEVKDNNGDEWIVLESHPSWEEPKIIGNDDWGHPRKEVWCQIRSYIVKSEEFENFRCWAISQNFMGRWMPEATNRYELFNREFYWSEAFKFFRSDYYGGSDWILVTDRESGSNIADVSVTSINYLWEEEFDQSKIESLTFLKPSNLIFEKMGLKSGEVEGSFNDKNGIMVCFAAEAVHASKPCLLVKKEPFLTMLSDNGFEIVWTLLGEKGVIGGSLTSNHHYGRQEFSGAFYYEESQLTGTHQTSLTK